MFRFLFLLFQVHFWSSENVMSYLQDTWPMCPIVFFEHFPISFLLNNPPVNNIWITSRTNEMASLFEVINCIKSESVGLVIREKDVPQEVWRVWRF